MFKYLILISCILCASSFALAQNPATLCSQSDSIDYDPTQLSGIWWEVARNPSPANNFGCVKVNFTMEEPDNVLEIATTYSNTPSYLWVNQTMYANISLVNSTDGYNISYINGITTTPYTVFKLLETDYQNYALICGYTNATDNNTSFGIILTRDRFPNATVINGYEESASLQYADFINGTMSLITQTPTCYAAGAASQYSLIATIFAVFFAILHFTV